jgi:hypothetical protein
MEGVQKISQHQEPQEYPKNGFQMEQSNGMLVTDWGLIVNLVGRASILKFADLISMIC